MSVSLDYFDYCGKKIAYQFLIRSIEKPTMVFLHDSLGCMNLWRDFPFIIVDIFDCNVLIYDRIGYGFSDPMDNANRANDYMELEAHTLNSLLAYLNISSASLFGHSDGASIALIAASLFPDKIAFVISEAAHVFVEPITLHGIEQTKIAYQNTDLPLKLAKYHGEKVDNLFKAWTETWLHPKFKSWQLFQYLKNIKCPLLIIQGTNDAYGSLAQVHSIANLTNGIAMSCLIENCDHSPHKEKQEIVLHALKQFKKLYLF